MPRVCGDVEICGGDIATVLERGRKDWYILLWTEGVEDFFDDDYDLCLEMGS